ncbi:unnamed protein product, partial [Ixodes persulcatus]
LVPGGEDGNHGGFPGVGVEIEVGKATAMLVGRVDHLRLQHGDTGGKPAPQGAHLQGASTHLWLLVGSRADTERSRMYAAALRSQETRATRRHLKRQQPIMDAIFSRRPQPTARAAADVHLRLEQLLVQDLGTEALHNDSGAHLNAIGSFEEFVYIERNLLAKENDPVEELARI